ncbi:hypothetical protein ACGFRB_11965 [Streptomyces sp. NPDC048718]|uniref:hypothetical protein n=1 Tax=Streptomyces sp. NPDC048718 TaxID=3365587 RepID=UPI003712882E
MRTTRVFLAALPLIAAITVLGTGPAAARAVTVREDCGGGGTEIMSNEEYELRYGTGNGIGTAFPPAPPAGVRGR